MACKEGYNLCMNRESLDVKCWIVYLEQPAFMKMTISEGCLERKNMSV